MRLGIDIAHAPLNVTDHRLTRLQHFVNYPSTFYLFSLSLYWNGQ